MANTYFQFKKFRIDQAHCAMKVSTDACMFGAWAIEQIGHTEATELTLLDIGAGTGLISLMLAQCVEGAQITAVEIDERSAVQANENVRASPWPNKIRVIASDIRDIESTAKFDRIISNPPFYEGDLNGPDAQKNIAHHDASLPFEDLLMQIDRLISEEGVLYLLLPLKKLEKRIKLLAAMRFLVQKQTYLHHAEEHAPLRIFLELRRNPEGPIQSDRINLMLPDGTYTDRTKQLLKDFYLNF